MGGKTGGQKTGGQKTNTPVKIKKVNPYPIHIVIGGQTGKILKVAETGFLVETPVPLQVGLLVETSFDLPVMNKIIRFNGVVVKTYDHFGGELGDLNANRKIAEVGFKNLGELEQKYIAAFLVRIGQKPK